MGVTGVTGMSAAATVAAGVGVSAADAAARAISSVSVLTHGIVFAKGSSSTARLSSDDGSTVSSVKLNMAYLDENGYRE